MFAFQATYSGDGTYASSTGPCEPLTVTQVASSTVTVIHDADAATVTSVPAGTAVHDQATVTGGRPADADGDGDVLVVHQRHLCCDRRWRRRARSRSTPPGWRTRPAFTQTPRDRREFAFQATYSGDAHVYRFDGAV